MIKSLLFAAAIFLCTPHIALAQSAAQPDRVVRVTTGYHQVSGWEKPLVQGNPNLAHYHWTPLNAYDQGYLHIRSPQRPQGSVYVKPIHVSPDAYVPKVRESQPLANHVDPPPSRRETTLAGQIMPQRSVQGIAAQPPKIATYSDLDARGTLLSRSPKRSRNSFSSSESVSGQLLSRNKRQAI